METRIKNILSVFIISLVLVPTVIFAGTMQMGPAKDRILKKIAVAPKQVDVPIGSEQDDFREKITVYAYYKGDKEPVIVENYETNFDDIEQKEGSFKVIIEYTEGKCTKCTKVCVNFTPEEDAIDKKIYAYVSGYPDGTFKPDQAVTRAELASMIANLLTENKVPEQDNKFSDVSNANFSKDAINYIVENGIIMPTSENMFSPQDTVSAQEAKQILETLAKKINRPGIVIDLKEQDLIRGEAVKILNKLFDISCELTNGDNRFSDVNTRSPYYRDIICATREN